MTLTPTPPIIIKALAAQNLRLQFPLRPRGEPKRWLFASEQVALMLAGSHPDHPTFPVQYSDGLVGRFSAGQYLTASLSGNPDARVDFKRLAGLDEVWSVRIGDALKPGWRVLGRFIERDQFIGLVPFDRHERYGDKPEKMLGEWSAILGGVAPIRGSTVAEYMSGPVNDTDITEGD